ncbi:MAG: hypothetical protein ACC642_01820 [Pseudomonadales bacterium]
MTERAVKTRRSARAGESREPPTSDPPEPISQFTLKLRESLHRELARKAFNSGMTMRGFIMSALKKAGLNVTDVDLVDRRRR